MPARPQQLAHLEYLGDATKFAGQIQALLSRPSAGDVLAAIDVPALILCGRQDAWATLAVHEDMAARVKGSPDSTAGALASFMARTTHGHT